MFDKSYSHLIGTVVRKDGNVSILIYTTLCGHKSVEYDTRMVGPRNATTWPTAGFTVALEDGCWTFTNEVAKMECDECALLNLQRLYEVQDGT